MAAAAKLRTGSARIREFSRSFTAVIGALDRGYLDTPHSLQEARVLYEIATAEGCTAKNVQARTGFDQGYLSRLIARLEKAQLVRRQPSAKDRRARHLRLTPKGVAAFQLLDERANQQANGLLDRLSPAKQAGLVQALDAAQRLLELPGTKPQLVVRSERVGDVGWTLYRQAVVYKAEFGYDDVFQTYLAESLPPYLNNYVAAKDHLWVAELGGRPCGFIAVHHDPDRPGWAKLRWFLVEREARGHGAGSRLLATAIEFCRAAGYRGIFLWTVNDLDAARRLYQRAGFRLAHEKRGCEWASWGREQRWELDLRGPTVGAPGRRSSEKRPRRGRVKRA